MMKIVFFTGADMSEESGLPIFRGDGGVWNDIDYDKVATRKSWNGRRRGDVVDRRQAMLDFFNPLRRMILRHDPNVGHYIIADLENGCEVTVITQNGDDYHTRAGSSSVIYLHGEALKNASSANPYLSFPIDRDNPDIHIGDKAPDGSQIRPFVIYFDEDIDKKLWHQAAAAVKEADWLVVVGSSMKVYPAASLLGYVRDDCHVVVIDPDDIGLPEECYHGFIHIPEKASVGLWRLRELMAMYEPNNKYFKQFLSNGKSEQDNK